MTNLEFARYCDRLHFTDLTRGVVKNIRESPPSRNVHSGPASTSGKYRSLKMDVSIQFESRHVEKAALISTMEFGDDVREFYDQPPQFKLPYTGKNGRNQAMLSTPDYFLLRDDAAGWLQLKTEQELVALAEQQPDLWSRRENGSWSSPAGVRYASLYGLEFWVTSSKELNMTLVRNHIFLQSYYRAEQPAVEESLANSIRAFIEHPLGRPLSELLDEFDVDAVYTLIAQRLIHLDLGSQVIATEAHLLPVFRDEHLARAHAETLRAPSSNFMPRPRTSIQPGDQVCMDDKPWTVLGVTPADITLLPDGNTKPITLARSTIDELERTGHFVREATESDARKAAQERLVRASRRQLEAANQRLRAIQPVIPSRERRDLVNCATYSKSYQRKLKRRAREEGMASGFPLVGLLDRTHERGNRTQRLPPRHYELMDQVVTEHYRTLDGITPNAAYGYYELACEAESLEPASYRAFMRRIKADGGHSQKQDREGERAAYDEAPFLRDGPDRTSTHGDRPWERVHVDHTPLDLHQLNRSTRRAIGRLWLTVMIDEFTRRVLAFYITYDPPSYRSIMMVARECVRRFGRLPDTLITDNGREFHSIYYDLLCEDYHIGQEWRPKSKPRFGAVIERFLGVTNRGLIQNLQGNNKILQKNARAATKRVDPRRRALLSIEETFETVYTWCYETYDAAPHSAHSCSPRELFDWGISQFGRRVACTIDYNDPDFLFKTMPSTRQGTARVDAKEGVKINYLSYWCDEFALKGVAGNQVEVRYEPFDIFVAWAYVRGRWTKCKSNPKLEGYSERQLRLALEEIRANHRGDPKRYAITAKDIAKALLNAHSKAQERQQESDTQMAALRDAHSNDLPAQTAQDIDMQDKATDLAPNGTQTESVANLTDFAELGVLEVVDLKARRRG